MDFNKNSLVSFKNIYDQIQVDTPSRRVSGYFAAFGNKDSDNDVILHGAFKKSIKERGAGSTAKNKIAYLWQHDMHQPLGKIEVLNEDSKGLYFEASVSEFDLGDRVLAQYKDGTLNQHSIGFRYISDKMEYDEEQDTFYIKEVNLFEGSVVTLGANPETEFSGFKDQSEKDYLRGLEKFIKTLNLSTEEIYELRKHFETYKHLKPFEKDTSNRIKEVEDAVAEGIDYNYLIKNLT